MNTQQKIEASIRVLIGLVISLVMWTCVLLLVGIITIIKIK